MLRALPWIPVPVALCSAALCSAAGAQEPGALTKIELRVLESRPGTATLDRGGDDGIVRGDRVMVRLKDGGVVQGTVTRVEARACQVELDDQSVAPPPGTRAETHVPSARFAAPEPPEAPPENPLLPPPETEAPPGHAPWPERDDQWSAGLPLLARVRPLQPRQRPSDLRGRVYGIVDFTSSTEDDRTDAFARAGTDWTLENRWGRGERVQLDAEWNWRHTAVPDDDDRTAMHLRVDRLSYVTGGNRFEPERLELGRFLQDTAPEFGVLDGVEWSRRFADGDRFGVSAGFQPEPDPNLQSVQDFQVAAAYRWVFDESEQVSATAGYQKSWHNAHIDRDLLLAQFHYLPLGGWTFSSTAWLDWYSAGDATKSQGVELTQARVVTGKRWENDNSLHLAYVHDAFPELDRHEFLPVTAQQLADDRVDRVSLSSRVHVTRRIRVHGVVAAWADQDDEGHDGVGGVELADLVLDDLVVDVSAFATQGKFVDVAGVRATVSRLLAQGRISGQYELADSRFDGFTSANDDLPHHRLRLAAELWFAPSWSVSGHVQGMLWDHETSVQVGFYLQRSL